MNTKIIGVAAIALVLAQSANALPIKYEFTATLDQLSFNTLDPVPPTIENALLPIRGQTLTGSFFYDSEAPFLFTGPAGTNYNHAVSGLTGNFAGASFVGPNATQNAGVALVSDGPSQDILSFGVSVSGDPILGYALRNLTIAWVEGVPQFDPLPDFLSGTSLPTDLPTQLQPQFVLSFLIPDLAVLNPVFTSNASFSAYQGTIQRVSVPEPTSIALVLGGLLMTRVFRRRRAV